LPCSREEGLRPARSRKGRREETKTYSIARSVFNVVKRIPKYEEDVMIGKPLPIGKPVVWASLRRELCETLTYFRAYQGGIYFWNGVAFGYLLDRFGAERDYIGSHVVISHGYELVMVFLT
jgi:hypothetical protein